MASLKLDHIYKVYPNGTKAVNDFTLDVKDGEFIVFVGPSGCGKSTTLRMIAGLEEITAGELYIGDTLVNDVEPKDRDIAMVFQNYALYPHMTVYENMAFGLTLRHVPKNEIHQKVMWAADILGLKDYLDRKPRQMSGGQRQRVALGRAILRNPKVMLLDEPLSNLDAKLRSQMRSEISKLHLSLKTTFIYVTHDQVEAMTLGTRVVVMKLGDIQQVDTPKNLYDHPLNKFVAGFIGTPQMNFYEVTLTREEDRVRVHFLDSEQNDLHLPYAALTKARKLYLAGTKPVTLGFRCEAASVEEEDLKKGDNIIDVVVSHFEELGNETLIYGDLNDVSVFSNSKTNIIIKASSTHGYRAGDHIKVRIDLGKAHYFDSETEMTILPRIPKENVFPVLIKEQMMSYAGISHPLPAALSVKKLQGQIEIPLTALCLSRDGELPAKIIMIEDVDGKKLAYLRHEGHYFFALIEPGHRIGEEVRLKVDHDRVRLYDEEGKIIIEPLVEKDAVLSTFVNFKTMMARSLHQLREKKAAVIEEEYAKRVKKIKDQAASQTGSSNEAVIKEELSKAGQERKARLAELRKIDDDGIYVPLRKERLAKAKKDEEAAKEALSAKYAKLLAAVDESSLPLKRLEGKKTLQEQLALKREELKKVRAAYHQALKETRIAKKKKIDEVRQAVNAEYAALLKKEVADYKMSLKTNKDRDAIRARKASLEIFKESLPSMRANETRNRINAVSFDFETMRNGHVSKYSLARYTLKQAMKDARLSYLRECCPIKTLKAEEKKEMASLKKSASLARLKAELLFFFDHDGSYQLIPDVILNKIIQGLGAKVFTKGFRIMIPHDAYHTVEKGRGLRAVVKGMMDYRSRRFYVLETMMHEIPVILHAELKEELQVGQEVSVLMDLTRCEIHETGMNIRLY